MANPISDFMSNWLNTTYEYLKKTGGPTYPKVTVAPSGIPGKIYGPVEDYLFHYGNVPQPFNFEATGIPATANSQIDAVIEEGKQNPPPTTFSKHFGLLYGNSMSACIADQKHGHNNPNASSACQAFAERGDSSGLSLMGNQKEALGIKTLIQDENDKPDDVRLTENEDSLTGQIGAGAKNLWERANEIVRPDKKEDGTDPMENPEGVNFQNIGKKVSDLIPKLPDIPGTNSGSLMMIGGAALLVLLLIVIVK